MAIDKRQTLTSDPTDRTLIGIYVNPLTFKRMTVWSHGNYLYKALDVSGVRVGTVRTWSGCTLDEVQDDLCKLGFKMTDEKR